MADGYARASGGIGTALVVPGPGLQNASAGIGTAYSASSPILVVSGQIQREFIGVDRGMLHEVNDQLDTIRPVTKWARRILKVEEVPEAVREAFLQLRSGRPRPVEIEIPPETLAETGDVELLEPAEPVREAARRRPHPGGCRNVESRRQACDPGRRGRDIVAGRRGAAAAGRVPAGAGAHHQRGEGGTVGPSRSGPRRPAAAPRPDYRRLHQQHGRGAGGRHAAGQSGNPERPDGRADRRRSGGDRAQLPEDRRPSRRRQENPGSVA